MKNNKAIKILALTIAAILLLSSLFTVTSFAANTGATEWSFSEDETYLTNETDGIVYEYFFEGVAIRPYSKYIYVYDQPVSYNGDEYYFISSNPNNSEAVWIEDGYGYQIFVTEKYKENLVAFAKGEGVIGGYFVAKDNGNRAEISGKIIEKLDSQYATGEDCKTYDVRYLKSNKICDIIVQDASNTFAYTRGAIYSMDGEWWYINYTDLDASYFDANGNFSYYQFGTVTMTKVDDNSLETIDKCRKNSSPYEPTYEYEIVIPEEMGGSLLKPDGAGGVSLGENSLFDFEDFFWIVYFAFIVIPAIALVVVGCVLPFIKKLGKPKYWFIVSGFAALWAIAAIVHWILLAFPQLWQ